MAADATADPPASIADMLRQMLVIRAFEERVAALYRAGKVPGLTHLSTGQEAIAVGVCATLDDRDRIASSHRGHGHCLARGTPPDVLMAEILGRATGISGGRGGSMHIFDASTGNLGTNGIVGGGVPLALGAALAARSEGRGGIAVAFFGDGALNQGIVLECVNLAVVRALPLVLVCEHNGYGEFTAADDVTAGLPEARLAAYDLPVQDIDGMDVVAVAASMARAAKRARSGEGPSALLCRAWRYSGHHAGDAQAYKDGEESRSWAERDPITRERERLLASGIAEAELDGLEVEAGHAVAAAAKAALAAPFPEPDHLAAGLYA